MHAAQHLRTNSLPVLAVPVLVDSPFALSVFMLYSHPLVLQGACAVAVQYMCGMYFSQQDS
jgi:hypothetical protein